jgi:hypothetical protein
MAILYALVSNQADAEILTMILIICAALPTFPLSGEQPKSLARI